MHFTRPVLSSIVHETVVDVPGKYVPRVANAQNIVNRTERRDRVDEDAS